MEEQSALKRVLEQGGKVLVVGGRGANFDPALRAHPNLIFWDSTDPRTLTRALPLGVRGLAFTRFVGHPVYVRLIREARKRRIVFMRNLGGTGEIKRLLGTKEEPMEATIAEQGQVKLQRGQLQKFLEAHADLGRPRAEEAKRLLPIAHAAGLMTTEGSINQGLYKLAREKGPSLPAKREKAPVVVSEATTETLKLLDDAVAALHLIRERVEQLGNLEKLQKVIAELRL